MKMIVTVSKGDIKTTIDEELFEKKYKAKGWKIDSYDTSDKQEVELSNDEFVVKTANEEVVKNYNTAKKTKPKKFDDNIIKEK